MTIYFFFTKEVVIIRKHSGFHKCCPNWIISYVFKVLLSHPVFMPGFDV